MSDELDINYDEPAVLPDDPEEAQRRVEWHARMVRHYQGQLDLEVGAFKREIDRLRAEIAARTKTAEARIAWHTAPVESYHKMLIAGDKDLRTIRMPHATSKITVPKKPVIVVNDDGGDDWGDQIVDWMAEYHRDGLSVPGITAIRYCVDVMPVDEGEDHDGYVVVDKETGEVLPFLKAYVPEPTYKLTPEEGTPL